MSLAEGMSDLYEIFEQALSEPPARRAAFLAHACGERSAMRSRIERLLVLAEDGIGFLDRSPLHPPILADFSDPAYQAGHRIGAYRLLRRLGAGGMAEVWLAERTEGGFEQHAAVKIIRDMQSSVSRHFATERGILASLVHPGIARLYDGGVGADGSAYMVMEYVEGQHFIAYCNERKLGVSERLDLFLQICDAVAYAHTHLVIHRDLKPANILVTAEGTVKLLDFGIAKVLDQEGTKEITRTLHMSPAYAAPEQLAGGQVGTSTDVYSLGVILFELLTETLPWSGDASSLTLAVKRLLDAKAPPPSRVVTAQSPIPARAIKGDLDAIVAMALRREPAARYPDARALADEIRRHLDHKPVQARTGARAYVLRRFLRRHWIGLSATAGLFVAMAVAMVGIAWQARKAELEAQRAAAVQSFMIDLFRSNSSQQPDPVKARQTTARELLDMGAKRVERGLSEAPAERLKLLRVFADLYNDLGLRPEEVRIRREAVEMSRKLYGNESTEVASDLVALADAMQATNAVNQAGARLQEAKAILDRLGDTTSMLRGRLLVSTAASLQVSDIPRARATAQQAVDVFSRYPPSADLAEALYTVGLTSGYGGEALESLPSLKRAIAISSAVDGVPNSKLPIYYYQLAENESHLLMHDEAERDAREALALSVAINGNDHIYAMRTRLKVGQVLLEGERIKEGLALMLQARDQLPALVGDDDRLHRPVVLHATGIALSEAGDLDGALADLESSLAIVRRLDLPQLTTVMTLQDIAEVLIDLGRTPEALRDLDETQAIRERVGRPGKSTYTLLRVRAALDEGRLDDARTEFASLPAIAGTAPAETLAMLQRALLDAEIELRGGNATKAAALAAETGAAARGRDDAAHLRLMIATSEMLEGEGRLRAGDADAAYPLLARTLATREDLLLPKSPSIAEAELALAECEMAKGRRADAVALVGKAQAIEDQHSSLSLRYREPLARLRARLTNR